MKYRILTMDGEPIAADLTWLEANRQAKRFANQAGDAVQICGDQEPVEVWPDPELVVYSDRGLECGAIFLHGASGRYFVRNRHGETAGLFDNTDAAAEALHDFDREEGTET